MNLRVIHWDSSWGPITETTMKHRLETEGCSVAMYRYPPGTYFPPHAHSQHKKDAVLRGRLKIGWEGGSAILERGDMIEIPAGATHSAEVVGPETVVSLDATRNKATEP